MDEIGIIKRLHEQGKDCSEISNELNRQLSTIQEIVNNDFKEPKHFRGNLYNLNENYFDEINDKQLWLIGLLAADGNVQKNSFVGITQSNERGKKIIEYIKNELEYEGPIYTGNVNNFMVRFTSRKIVDRLSDFNIIANKSLIYELPKFNNENELRDFLRGYIEGDGCVGVYDNGKGYKFLHISFVGTESFIKECKEQIPFQYSSLKQLKSENCWELRFNGEKAIDFGKWVFGNENLLESEKVSKFKEFVKNHSFEYKKYDQLKQKASEFLKQGFSIMEVADKLNMHFQTLYKWRNKQKI